MKKTVALLTALLVLASLVAGCTKPGDGDVIPIGPGTAEPVQTPDASGGTLTLTEPVGAGMIAAGSVHSLGARSDGTVVAAGHNTAGQNAVVAWSNVVAVAAYEETSAAVTYEGKVLLAGKNSEALSAALDWADIWAVALGENHIIGLKSDGTVVAAGTLKDEVSAWTNIVQIAAAGGHALGLKADGTVVAAGDNAAGQTDVSAWANVVKVAAGKNVSAAVTREGKALSTKEDLSAWANVTDIAVNESMTAGVTSSGAVLSLPESAEATAIQNAASVAAGSEHMLVMKLDGTVAGFGSDSDFQLSVNAWMLRPYMESGYIFGFAPGMSALRVKRVLALETGGAITLEANGAEVQDAAPVFTGVEVLKDGAAYATLVLLGDVNGDSIINAADASAIITHLDGSAKLEGAHLAAAGINLDSEGNVAASSADAINNAVILGTPLSQFRAVKTASVYADKIAATAAKNKDVVGYITIPGTNIDYPILYNPSNQWFYNDHDVDKKQSSSAALYPYYNQFTQNNVITGHNARISGTMLHQLHHIQEYNLGQTKCSGKNCKDDVNQLTSALPDLKTYKGRVFTISLYGDESQWEVFSMYETPADKAKNGPSDQLLYYNTWFPPAKNWKNSPEEIEKWINTQLEKSEIDFGVKPTPEETFVTFFTCGNEHSESELGSRLYFFLHKVG